MTRRLLLLSLALTQCTQETSVESVPAALGQPTGDYPNYDERVALYITNRSRTDPAKAGWSSYAAQPPLQWHYDLNRSARAHSVDMRDTPCFQHESCNGQDTFDRINSFYTGKWSSEGENISAGITDGITAVEGWISEAGAAPGTTGHRDNIFSSSYTLVGLGYAPGGTTYKGYWTQDFVGTTVQRPHLTDGIHFPVSGANITFGTTYYDSTSKAASRVEVILDGVCHALSLTRGTAANATYEAQLPVASGCHQYYFRSTTGGVDSLYPDTGSLQVAGNSTTCALFTTAHIAPACDSASPDLATVPAADLGGSQTADGGVSGGGGDGSGGGDGNGDGDGSGENGGDGNGGGGDPGTGGGSSSGGDSSSGGRGGNTVGGCALAAPGSAGPSGLLLLGLAWILWRRRQSAERRP